jgi:hypothetical protein
MDYFKLLISPSFFPMILRTMRKLVGRLAACLLLALLVLMGMPGRAAVVAEIRVGDFFAEPLISCLADAPRDKKSGVEAVDGSYKNMS